MFLKVPDLPLAQRLSVGKLQGWLSRGTKAREGEVRADSVHFHWGRGGRVEAWPLDGQDQVGNQILLSFVFFYLPAF